MSGPIVRSGPSATYSKNFAAAFGGAKTGAKAEKASGVKKAPAKAGKKKSKG